MTTQRLSFDWATDDLYSSGPDTGQPTKVAPSAGRLATGLRGNDPFSAAVYNWLINNLGKGLDDVADVPALNYGAEQTLLTATAFRRSGTSKIVSLKMIKSGETIARDYLAFTDTTNGVWSYGERSDSTTWVDGTSPAFGAPSSNIRGGFLSGVPYAVEVKFGGVATNATTGTYTAKKLTDVTGAWAAAGTFGAGSAGVVNAEVVHSSIGGVDRWHYALAGQIVYSTDLSTWSSVSLGGTPINRCGTAGVASSDGVAYCTMDLTGVTVEPETWYSHDALAWTRVTSAPLLTALSYSDARQEWVGVASSTGHIWTAPAGMSAWTDRGNPGWGTPVGVRAFGRCYAVATSLGLFVSRAGAAGPWVAVLRPQTAAGFTDLTICAGQLVVAEYEAPAGVAQNHVYRSLRAPFLVF